MMSTAEIKRNAHDEAQNDCQSRNSTIQTYFNEVKECFCLNIFRNEFLIFEDGVGASHGTCREDRPKKKNSDME